MALQLAVVSGQSQRVNPNVGEEDGRICGVGAAEVATNRSAEFAPGQRVGWLVVGHDRLEHKADVCADQKSDSTRRTSNRHLRRSVCARSEEHTSELQS